MKFVQEFSTSSLRDKWLTEHGFVNWDHEPNHPGGWMGAVFVTNCAGVRLYVDGTVLYEDSDR